MRIFRCLNQECSEHPHGRPGFDFQAATDKMPDGSPLECPKCGSEALVPVLPVHLLVKDKAGPIKTGLGRRTIACRPDIKTISGRLTGEPAAVTCPSCQASEAYKALESEIRVLDEHEIPDIGTPLGGHDAKDGD